MWVYKINSLYRLNTTNKLFQEATEKINALLGKKIGTKEKVTEAIKKFQMFFQKLAQNIDKREKHLQYVCIETNQLRDYKSDFHLAFEKTVELHNEVISTLRALFISDQDFKASFTELLKMHMGVEHHSFIKNRMDSLNHHVNVLDKFVLFDCSQFETMFGFGNPFETSSHQRTDSRAEKINNFILRHSVSKRQTSLVRNELDNKSDINFRLRTTPLQKHRLKNPVDAVDSDCNSRFLQTFNNPTNKHRHASYFPSSNRKGLDNISTDLSKTGISFGGPLTSKKLPYSTQKKSFFQKKVRFLYESEVSTNSKRIASRTQYVNPLQISQLSSLKTPHAVTFIEPPAYAIIIDQTLSSEVGDYVSTGRSGYRLTGPPVRRTKTVRPVSSHPLTHVSVVKFVTCEIISTLFININNETSEIAFKTFLQKHSELKIRMGMLYRQYTLCKNLLDQKKAFLRNLFENLELIKKTNMPKNIQSIFPDESIRKTLQKKTQQEKQTMNHLKKASSAQEVFRAILLSVENLKSINKMDGQISFISSFKLENNERDSLTDISRQVILAEKEFKQIDFGNFQKSNNYKIASIIQNKVFREFLLPNLPLFRFLKDEIQTQINNEKELLDSRNFIEQTFNFVLEKSKKGLYLFYLKILFFNTFLKSSTFFLKNPDIQVVSDFKKMISHNLRAIQVSKTIIPNRVASENPKNSKLPKGMIHKIIQSRRDSQSRTESFININFSENLKQESHYLKNNDEDNSVVRSHLKGKLPTTFPYNSESMKAKDKNNNVNQPYSPLFEFNQTINKNYKIIQALKKGVLIRPSKYIKV